MVLSCTVSGIRRLIGWKLHIFLPLSYSAPPLTMFPLKFCGEVKRQETRVMELLCSEGCMILNSTAFDWSARVTVARYSIMLSFAIGLMAMRQNNSNNNFGAWPQTDMRFSSIGNNNNNNNNNNHDDIYSAVIIAEPLREFTRFTWW